MNVEDILIKEERYRRKMQTQWEMYGHKFINKYYKRDRTRSRPQSIRGGGSVFLAHQKGTTTANIIDSENTEYLYLYKVDGRNLSGILFYDIDISRHGYSVEYFPEDFVEITKEEFDRVMKLFIDRFRFDIIFNL